MRFLQPAPRRPDSPRRRLAAGCPAASGGVPPTAGTRPSNSAISRAGWAFCSPRRCSAGAPAAISTPARGARGKRTPPEVSPSEADGSAAEDVPGRAGARRRRTLGRRRRPATSGRHRLLSPGLASRRPGDEPRRQVGRRPPRALLTGAGLPRPLCWSTVLAVSLWPNERGWRRPRRLHRRSSSRTLSPAPGSGDTARSAPSTRPDSPPSAGRTRLRNLAADLCLDIRGATAEEGAGARAGGVLVRLDPAVVVREATVCCAASADPELCLDSHADTGVVFLGRCVAEDAKRGDDMRYDLTAQGELLPRWDDGLAVATRLHRPGRRCGGQGPRRLRPAAVADRRFVGRPRFAADRGHVDKLAPAPERTLVRRRLTRLAERARGRTAAGVPADPEATPAETSGGSRAR